jgi:hypothetical protein
VKNEEEAVHEELDLPYHRQLKAFTKEYNTKKPRNNQYIATSNQHLLRPPKPLATAEHQEPST